MKIEVSKGYDIYYGVVERIGPNGEPEYLVDGMQVEHMVSKHIGKKVRITVEVVE